MWHAGQLRNPLQADHLTYENYNATGRTPISDLKTLCRYYHELATGGNFIAPPVRPSGDGGSG